MSRSFIPLVSLLFACGGAATHDLVGEDPEDQDATSHAFSMRVSSMRMADEGVGFDLDDHDTRSSSDPVGCGKVDAEAGVDSALVGQRGTLEYFGFDLDQALSDAIRDGDLILDFDVTGYDGPDDDDVRIDVSANGDVVATNVHATVEGDVLFAYLTTLPLTGEVSGTSFQVNVRQVHLELPLSGTPSSVTVSGGLIAGGLPWDEPGENDLRALVLPNVPQAMQGLAESFVQGALDLQPDGAGACDAISATLLISAS